jgi:hypothetical protein
VFGIIASSSLGVQVSGYAISYDESRCLPATDPPRDFAALSTQGDLPASGDGANYTGEDGVCEAYDGLEEPSGGRRQETGGKLEASRHQISNSYSTKRTSNIFGHHLPVMKKVSAVGS